MPGEKTLRATFVKVQRRLPGTDVAPHCEAPASPSHPAFHAAPLPACRRARVAELLKQAGCPEGFRFTNPEGFDLGAKLRQSEPHKLLLSGPLPSRPVQLAQPLPPQQLPPQEHGPVPAAPGVLAEQASNQQAPPARRSGFQVPAAKPSQPGHQPTALDAFRKGQQQQQQQGPSAPTQAPARPAPDSRWAAKLPRRAQDAHVHQSRRHSSEEEVVNLDGSGSGGEEEQEQGKGIPGFQTARSKLIADAHRKGQQYNPSQFGGGGGGGGGCGVPRQGLARPAAGGLRPAGLRKTGAAGWRVGQPAHRPALWSALP